MADRRSLLILSVLVLISAVVVASIVVLSAQEPSATPNPSETPAPSRSVVATLPPKDEPAVTMRDFVFKTEAVTSVSASPAQSKLWYAEGAWWAGLYSPDANEIHIFRLDWPTQTWLDTGTVVDERAGADSDYLWTGEYLYAASASKGSASSHRAKIKRFHFDIKLGRFVGDADFPVVINDTGASGIVIDRDTRAGLWVTYVSGGSLWVAHTLSSDAHWAAPYKVPGSGALVNEDTSSLIPFGPGRIGVLWTDQTTERMLFTSHRDGEADDVWTPVEVVATGVGTNDDQLNLKTFELGGSSRGRHDRPHDRRQRCGPESARCPGARDGSRGGVAVDGERGRPGREQAQPRDPLDRRATAIHVRGGADADERRDRDDQAGPARPAHLPDGRRGPPDRVGG